MEQGRFSERSNPSNADTGDFVLHKPSGEEWVVAYVENGRVACCGWPYTLAELSDCQLTAKATPEKRQKLLEYLSNMSGDDPRKTYALRVIAEQSSQAAQSELDALDARIEREGLTSMPVREALADVQHEIWSHWMRYFFTKTTIIRPHPAESVPDKDYRAFPVSLAERWIRQMDTHYADLSEQEKNSDREQADKILAVLPQVITLQAEVQRLEADNEKLLDYVCGMVAQNCSDSDGLISTGGLSDHQTIIAFLVRRGELKQVSERPERFDWVDTAEAVKP